MPPKLDLVFHTAPIVVETDHSAFTVQLSPTKPAHDFSHTTRPMAPIIEPVSAVVPKNMVTRPRHAHSLNTKSNSTIRRHKTHSQSLKTNNSSPKVTAAKAQVGNPQYALKDNGVINSGCSRHMTKNMSYLSDFQELNGGYVALGGNPKGGKISGKGKIKTDKKLARRNELKSHGTLLMAVPDKHQLKFNSQKDAKTLMQAIKKHFEGNTETKKVQKTLLKQQFENFTSSSSENLDQIHDRLQKLVSQLEIHGVSMSQE
nr:hypothetical protein [Tanacetum cinerariifolium]